MYQTICSEIESSSRDCTYTLKGKVGTQGGHLCHPCPVKTNSNIIQKMRTLLKRNRVIEKEHSYLKFHEKKTVIFVAKNF